MIIERDHLITEPLPDLNLPAPTRMLLWRIGRGRTDEWSDYGMCDAGVLDLERRGLLEMFFYTSDGKRIPHNKWPTQFCFPSWRLTAPGATLLAAGVVWVFGLSPCESCGEFLRNDDLTPITSCDGSVIEICEECRTGMQ